MFALVVVLRATVFPVVVPYNLWRSVPFYHNCNTSPGMCFRAFLSALGGTHLSEGKGVSDPVGIWVEVRRQPE